jgi:hypothetical protein
MKITSRCMFMALCLAAVPARSQSLGTPPLPIQLDLQYPSRLLAPIQTPDTSSLLNGVLNLLPKPVDMKLLILATTGDEPGLAALRALLDHMGTPHEVRLLARGQTMPELDNGYKGFYHGVILTVGNLGVCDPTCRSAMALNDWARLDRYAKAFKVRIVSYYTYPEARYGLVPISAISTSDASPASVALTTAGANVFKYLRPSASVKVANSYIYTAGTTAAAGETTTPILRLGNTVVGVTHRKQDGREYMALTMDNNPYLFHSAVFHYGIIHWVTKGIFLGSRKAFMTPQVDDLFLANDLFDKSNPACIPVGFTTDPTFDPAGQCPTLRIRGIDLARLAAWQQGIQANSQFSRFRVSMAFNGVGVTAAGGAAPDDSLVSESVRQRNAFYWINHTYDHENLDCFRATANSGVCRPANLTESSTEISRNVGVANSLGLPFDRTSMVTPAISGLRNPSFLSAAASAGIKYLIADLSRPEGVPAAANTGIVNDIQPGILMIPRRATNIFYNTTTGMTQLSGSEPDEYNYFYGPAGIFRIGGPAGPPFFTTEQSWTQIIDRESDALLGYMLRGEMYPSMFHQGNLYFYDGARSLFTDVVGSALNKFAAVSNLPVVSLVQSDLGMLMGQRMKYNAGQVSATLTPGLSIEIRTVGAADVPITGVCSQGCESYGADRQSVISMPAGSQRTILLLL